MQINIDGEYGADQNRAIDSSSTTIEQLSKQEAELYRAIVYRTRTLCKEIYHHREVSSYYERLYRNAKEITWCLTLLETFDELAERRQGETGEMNSEEEEDSGSLEGLFK